MKVNPDILKRAEEVLAEKRYEQTCIEAKICPVCGAPLVEKIKKKTVEDPVYGKKPWFGDAPIIGYNKREYTEYTYTACACPDDHYVVPNQIEYDDDSDFEEDFEEEYY